MIVIVEPSYQNRLLKRYAFTFNLIVKADPYAIFGNTGASIGETEADI